MNNEVQFEGGFNTASVSAYLHDPSAVNYNTDKRSRRDVFWTIAYCLLAALTLAGSIPVFLRTDPNTGLYSNRFFNNSTSCDVRRYQQVAWMYNDSEYDPTFMRRFKAQIAMWLPVTAGLAFIWSALYLFLFSRFPRTTLGIITLGSLLAGCGMSVLCFTQGRFGRPAGIVLMTCTILTTGIFLWLGRWARTSSELLATAADILCRNPWLVPGALSVKLAGLLVLAYGFGAFFSAINYGYVSRNWDAVQRYAVGDENGFCVNSAQQRIPCCIFVTSDWALAYSAAAAVYLVWSAALVLQIKTFTTGHTTARWYFATAPATRGPTTTYTVVADGVRLSFNGSNGFSHITASPFSSAMSVRGALRDSLTVSFGTLAAAAALLAPLRGIRWTCQGLLRADCLFRAASCVLRPLLSATEIFTRFTTVFAAMTGHGFLPSARGVFDMLQRNFQSPYCLWWVPSILLQTAFGLLALAWGGVVFIVTYATNKQYNPIVESVSFATAGAAFFLILYGLLFTASLQMDVVHSLYICCVLDKDQRRITHPFIHEAIRQLPGQVVLHREDNMMYGVPEPPPPPQEMPTAAASAATSGTRGPVSVQAPSGTRTAESLPPRAVVGSGAPSRLKRRIM